MIYLLTCGTCSTDNNVSAEGEPIVWPCTDCGNENSTSLPVTQAGTLITDDTKATAILSPSEAAAAHNVVVGEVIE